MSADDLPLIIGQRVIANGEIGYYVVPNDHGHYHVQGCATTFRVSPGVVADSRNWSGCLWVHLANDGYARCFDERNVRRLPGGQL